MTAATIKVEEVARTLGRHIPLYRRRAPVYQTVMLNALRTLWLGRHERLLDLGGGTGVIAQAIHDLFPVDHVAAIDIENRYLPGLSVLASTFDGVNIPFPDAAFDGATINNVLHHVPVEARADLLTQVRRVVAGPLYIKDHLCAGLLDSLRLTVLDFLGNVPFSGMVRARYLGEADWQALAAASGYRIAKTRHRDLYRSGIFGVLFPNRLEIAMRWEPIA